MKADLGELSFTLSRTSKVETSGLMSVPNVIKHRNRSLVQRDGWLERRMLRHRLKGYGTCESWSGRTNINIKEFTSEG